MTGDVKEWTRTSRVFSSFGFVKPLKRVHEPERGPSGHVLSWRLLAHHSSDGLKKTTSTHVSQLCPVNINFAAQSLLPGNCGKLITINFPSTCFLLR